MKLKKLIRKSDGHEIAHLCQVTDRLSERIVGLLGRTSLKKGACLWIEPCSSIHTCFMKFPIDVVYVDYEGLVLKIRRNVKPWRFDLPVFGARAVVEFAAGESGNINEGDTLCLS
jgi:uncharacterized membrane protein (UPF0127 family)